MSGAALAAAFTRETERLLASDPAAAEARARRFLSDCPGNLGALLLLGSALRRRGNFADAQAALKAVLERQPDIVVAHFELGLALSGAGQTHEAIQALTRAVDLKPDFANAWYALAEQFYLCQAPDGRATESDAQFAQALTAVRMGRPADAEGLLARGVENGPPGLEAARFLYAVALLAQGKAHHALAWIEKLIAENPGREPYRDLRASALFQVGNFQQAIAEYEDILRESPGRPGAWMSYGRALRALGRRDPCIAAFKRALELLPGWVEAWRTLASVKSYRLEPHELEILRAQIARPDLPATSYAELHYALGKASEDAGEYPESFDHYRQSAALQRATIGYSADASTRFLRGEIAVYTPAFFRERAGGGCQSAAPIFVVGMPRAGSTLVQEILCAHSSIERTGELRDLTWMAARLDNEKSGGAGVRYPEIVRTFGPDRFRALGEEYLQRTLPHRKLGLPHFVDKYPGNFLRSGLIHLILPNAKIVDVRRHPLDCCLSCFKHYFPEGPLFSHDLTDLGRYYADYVETMAHFDAVLPGKVHRIFYEDLIENPEQEVRRLLTYLNLPFEAECLRYYEREQAIMTSSVEQARTPIYKTGIGGWRNFEKWLDPLKAALGPVLDSYPAVPESLLHPRDAHDSAADQALGFRYHSRGFNFVLKHAHDG